MSQFLYFLIVVVCSLQTTISTIQQEKQTGAPESRARYPLRYYQHYDKYRNPGSGGQSGNFYRPGINQRPGGHYGSNQGQQGLYGHTQRPGGLYPPSYGPGGFYAPNQSPIAKYPPNQIPGGFYGPLPKPVQFYEGHRQPGGFHGIHPRPQAAHYGSNNNYIPLTNPSESYGKLSGYKDKGRGTFTMKNNGAELKCSLGDDIISNVIWVKAKGIAAANNFQYAPGPGPDTTYPFRHQSDDRFMPFNDKGEAKLTIYTVFPQDSGTYMCIGVVDSLLTNSRFNNKVYQTVEFYPQKE